MPVADEGNRRQDTMVTLGLGGLMPFLDWRAFGFVALAATALAACGGDGGTVVVANAQPGTGTEPSDDSGSDTGSEDGSEGSTNPTQGLADPGDIIGVDPAYIGKLENYQSILRQPVFDSSNLSDLPAGGTATYTGIGRITDASVNSDDITAASLRNRSVVTDVTATIDLGGPTNSFTATQTNFIDVDGNPVAGQVDWTVNLSPTSTGVFPATVTGNVGGTIFSTPTDQAQVVYLESGVDSGVAGLFLNGNVTTSGWLQGSTVTGDFAAD